MSRTKYLIRRARKTYTCSERIHHTIAKGDLYLYGAIPPEHECNRTRQPVKWEFIRACLICAEKNGMMGSELKKHLEELLRK